MEAQFEAAADAIITGDLDTLTTLLHQHPDLVQARSTRDHHSTLLHYVSANGVEQERQKTPPNIVEIAKLLLDSGSDINAESDAYRGHSTTLELTATSCHPEAAGVQLALMQLLIGRGARLDATIVTDCLHNGRGQAAEFLADHGAPLDFEAAAGVGRFDLVEQLFPTAPDTQRIDGFAWACEFGRFAVVEFMLQQDPEFATRSRSNGQTGLHWAAYFAHQDIVTLLLEHGASVDAREQTWEGTPLDWALHARNNRVNS